MMLVVLKFNQTLAYDIFFWVMCFNQEIVPVALRPWNLDCCGIMITIKSQNKRVALFILNKSSYIRKFDCSKQSLNDSVG
jgi:hypothetical protein